MSSPVEPLASREMSFVFVFSFFLYLWSLEHNQVQLPAPDFDQCSQLAAFIKIGLMWLWSLGIITDTKRPQIPSDHRYVGGRGLSSGLIRVTEARSSLPPSSPLTVFPSQEMISRQMNSVFKELLSRQPPVQQSALAAPAPSSSSSSSLPQAAPAAKKGGFGLRGRALFRPVD